MFKSKKLSKIKNLKHGFFNSIGGHSKDIYKSLNCGPGSNDKKLNIEKNLQIVKKKLAPKQKIFFYFINSIAINLSILMKNLKKEKNLKLMQ